MKWLVVIAALFALVLPGCSSDTAGCKYDTDCPGTEVCIDGSCREFDPGDPCWGIRCPGSRICVDGDCVAPDQDADGDGHPVTVDCDDADPDIHPGAAETCNQRDDDCDGQTDEDDVCEPDPCDGVECPSGQVCVDGDCVDEGTDADGDGYTVPDDCDDTDPAIHPGAAESCNQRDDDCDGATDEDNVCGQDCIPVEEDPRVTPPFSCDATTRCELCARYQEQNFYCRSLDGEPHEFLVLPDDTPCDPAHQCILLACAEQQWHCQAAAGEYLPGGIPTGDPEACNGLDDDCDGLTDEPGAEESCPPRPHATVTGCQDGACVYACDPGFHLCGDACLDDTSVENCGDRCQPCPQPDHATAVCQDGQCDFVCDAGYWKNDTGCSPCTDEAHCGPDCITCPGSTACCTDGCYDLTTDPAHCGGCDQPCPSLQDTCCDGEGCCPAAHPVCCGPYCCDADGFCCPGEFCCSAGGTCCPDGCCGVPNTVCCGAGCCPTNTTCCNDTYCCPPENPHCCPAGCCPQDHAVCCGDGCCPTGTTCCNDLYCCTSDNPVCCPNGCCPADFPVCCEHVCCPANAYCCEGGTACCL